jgi:hypothetical protein
LKDVGHRLGILQARAGVPNHLAFFLGSLYKSRPIRLLAARRGIRSYRHEKKNQNPTWQPLEHRSSVIPAKAGNPLIHALFSRLDARKVENSFFLTLSKPPASFANAMLKSLRALRKFLSLIPNSFDRAKMPTKQNSKSEYRKSETNSKI